ncbi:heavy-metal-associated domain-containing protein, partial [Xanthomonas perforans]
MTHVHKPTVRTRTWPIGDMVSAGCARTLEKAVAALPGVNATSANFATATLQVSYDPARLSAGARGTAPPPLRLSLRDPVPAACPPARRATHPPAVGRPRDM